MSATELNERLFMSFVAGWFAGVFAGTIYYIYAFANGYNFEHNFAGRLLIISISAALLTTLGLSMIVTGRISRELTRRGLPPPPSPC